MPSGYYNKRLIADRIARGEHRQAIGGMWDEIGDLQLSWLRCRGLAPHHTLLDIGCGSLRLGVRATRYLYPGHYWGTDLNANLMQAGFEREIEPAELADRLPRENLVEDGEFSFAGIPRKIDFAIATSVFTHLPLNHLRLCLANLAAHLVSPCTFYFTVFTPPEGAGVVGSYEQVRGITTHSHKDPYHYAIDDILYAATQLPWRIDYIGAWEHPRNQKMVQATLDQPLSV